MQECEIDVKARDFDMRYTVAEDVTFLEKCLSFPEVIRWLPFSLEGEEIANAIKVWMGFSRYNCSLTAIWKNEPCGMGIVYLMPYRKVAHHCLAKVVVPPNLQCKGIGGDLIKNLKHLAKNYFRQESIQMEMIEGNPILSLLEKQGFAELVRQDKYFKLGDEYFARVVMECDLNSTLQLF